MKLVFVLLLAWFAPLAFGGAISDEFRANGVSGTLIIASIDGVPIRVHNSDRAEPRFSPAPTFKILNTIIGFDTGVVDSKESRFKWDGVNRGLPAWNRDHTLETAYRASCVWCYQEVARQVGKRRYLAQLASVEYGNQQIGEEVDQFWLNNSLRISAREQIDFLGKLYTAELHYNTEHLAELKTIMLEDKTPDYSIYSKSGWTGPMLHIGWYVGFVETGDSAWLFAMNMDMDNVDQASLRKQIVISALRSLDII